MIESKHTYSHHNVVAVDLDGTLLEFDWDEYERKGYDYLGEPKRNAVEILRELKQLGYTIIIYSCRFTPSLYKNPKDTLSKTIVRVCKHLDKYSVPYDDLWIKEGKPKADFYIDDKAVEFTTWEHVFITIMNMREERS